MNMHKTNQVFHKKEKGQIIVLLAIMFIALIAVVGLAIDMGYLFVSYARLRKAVDSAALAATSQFREGYLDSEIRGEAAQFLKLNQVVPASAEIHIDTCTSTKAPAPAPDGILKYPATVEHPDGGDWGDAAVNRAGVCTNPPRKLVRVTVTEQLPLYFLSVVGIRSVPVTVYSISEAASVDLMLVVDSSDSMTNAGNVSMLDPKACNEANDPALHAAYGIHGGCEPFNSIKVAALNFMDRMFEGYDRVGIVTFDKSPTMVQPLTGNLLLVRDMLRGPEYTAGGYLGTGIRVYEGYPGGCEAVGVGFDGQPINANNYIETPIDVGMPCRMKYADGSYYGLDCPMSWGANDWGECTTTNIGGGLAMAGNALGGAYPAGFSAIVREEALWVVILLTDGAANAGYDEAGEAICPDDTQTYIVPCRDIDARPTLLDTSVNARHDYATDLEHYDADDYARDMVDFVTDPKDGQGALLFSIGLDGAQNYVTSPGQDVAGNAAGETLLKYAAKQGGGVYYYAPDESQLGSIFLDIANKIATRLSR